MYINEENELLRRKLWTKVCVARHAHFDRYEQADNAVKAFDARFTDLDRQLSESRLANAMKHD
jgi:hypothetical protein